MQISLAVTIHPAHVGVDCEIAHGRPWAPRSSDTLAPRTSGTGYPPRDLARRAHRTPAPVRGEGLQKKKKRGSISRRKVIVRAARSDRRTPCGSLCVSTRGGGREGTMGVLLHYDGHGVPRVRPTANGEIRLLDEHRTNYIYRWAWPNLGRWLGKPSIVVLDCGGASVSDARSSPHRPLDSNVNNVPNTNAEFASGGGGAGGGGGGGGGGDAPVNLCAIHDIVVLCPTAQGGVAADASGIPRGHIHFLPHHTDAHRASFGSLGRTQP
jgi:hypothetical protein